MPVGAAQLQRGDADHQRVPHGPGRDRHLALRQACRQHRRRRRLRHAYRRSPRGAERAARGRRGRRLRRPDGLRSGLRRHASLGPRDGASTRSPAATTRPSSSSGSTASWCATSASSASRTPCARTTGRASRRLTRALDGSRSSATTSSSPTPARAPRRGAGRGQRPALEGQPDRHAERGVDAAEAASAAGYGVCVSERSGETEDPVIADLTSRSTPDRSRPARRCAASAPPSTTACCRSRSGSEKTPCTPAATSGLPAARRAAGAGG